MTIKKIRQMQKNFGLDKAQKLIEDGTIWQFEGSVGRTASLGLEIGIFFLPDKRTFDYYGNMIPSRDDLVKGTKGTLENAENFWKSVEEGDFMAIEAIDDFKDFMNY